MSEYFVLCFPTLEMTEYLMQSSKGVIKLVTFNIFRSASNFVSRTDHKDPPFESSFVE